MAKLNAQSKRNFNLNLSSFLYDFVSLIVPGHFFPVMHTITANTVTPAINICYDALKIEVLYAMSRARPSFKVSRASTRPLMAKSNDGPCSSLPIKLNVTLSRSVLNSM